MKRLTTVSLVLVLSLFMVTAAYATSLNLVLAIDRSGSINTGEMILMMQGYQTAFQSPAVHNAIVAAGGINVYSFYWDGSAPLPPSLGGWTTLTDAASANAYGAFLGGFSGTNATGRTCIGCAITHANNLFASAPAAGHNIIDVTGDGRENVLDAEGNLNPPNLQARRDAALAGATDMINGLAITTDFPNLDTYYVNNVIGGVGSTGNPAFVVDAVDFNSFATAFEDKLLTELGAPEPGTMLLLCTGLLGLVGFRRKFRS